MEWPGAAAALPPGIAEWLVATSNQVLARQLDQMRNLMPPNGFDVPIEAADDDRTVDKTFRVHTHLRMHHVINEDDAAVIAERLRPVIMERIQRLVESTVHYLIHADARRYRIAHGELVLVAVVLELELILTVHYTDTPLADKCPPAN